MIQFSIAETSSDLVAILDLQKANLAASLTPFEIQSQGFVTVTHKYDELSALNELENHIIAKEGDKVIGYVLAMTKASATALPVLEPMFEVFDQIKYQNKPVSNYRYLVVGQVCIDKQYRGKGIFDQIYTAYKNRFQSKYDFAITEIAATNLRSQKAHQRIGFKELHRYFAPDQTEWSIVIWDWNN